MSYDNGRFAHFGQSWSERARLGKLDSVLYAGGPERINLMMHAATLVGAKVAMGLCGKAGRDKVVLLDFGCGTGRTMRFFGQNGYLVVGTEITLEMLVQAQRYGLPEDSGVYLTDGVSIPLRDRSVDLIWVCGVLKYSLFEPESLCRGGSKPDTVDDRAPLQKIVKEMYRVLKPGGHVVDVEMWVDAPPEVFTPELERAGFLTDDVRVLRRYLGRLENLMGWRSWHRVSPNFVMGASKIITKLRYHFDNPIRKGGGLRDYLFVWSKPKVAIS